MRTQSDEPLLDTLIPALLGRRILLVLDNAEHLLPSLSDDLSALMSACSTLPLLVTSRGRLQLAGESTWPVPPLSAPDAERLFVERARQIGVELEPGLVIGELCARLDQMPLAIELAPGSGTKTRFPAAILGHSHTWFSSGCGGASARCPKHVTASIARSVRLPRRRFVRVGSRGRRCSHSAPGTSKVQPRSPGRRSRSPARQVTAGPRRGR